MPVRLGDIELTSVQDVRADDNRTLVELRVPGQAGSVFQDLGRAPASVVLAGLLVGEGAADTLERLRAAYQKAKALAFASDIAIGTELTEVVIADLVVRQESGYRDRYRYTLKIREHVEPPEDLAANQAAVDDAVAAEAAAWTAESAAASDALADPAGLADALEARPELLAHLSADQLAQTLGDNLDLIEPGKLGDVMDRVAAADPGKASDLLGKLKGQGKLAAFVDKLLTVGRTILGVARKLGGILMHLGELMDLINAARDLAASARPLIADARDFQTRWSARDLWTPPADELTVPTPTPRDLSRRVDDLVAALARLVGQELLHKLRDLAREYGLGGAVDTAARALITAAEAVQKLVGLLRTIADLVAHLWLVTTLAAGLGPLLDVTDDLLDPDQQQAARTSLRGLRWAAALLRAAPGRGELDALAASFTDLITRFRHFTLADLPRPLPGAPR